MTPASPTAAELLAQCPWVACGIPDCVVVDNGMDLRSRNVVAAFQALGIDLVYTPPRTPWYKGVIERFGRTMNTRFVHWLPGTTLGKPTGDLGYDGKDHAVLTFEAFKQLLETYIRVVHNRTPRRDKPGSPLKRYLTGIAQWPVRMPVSQDEFDAAVALTETAELQQSGLWYQGLQYQNDVLMALWNRVPAKTVLTLKVNPLDLQTLKVLLPVTQQVVSVACVTPIQWPRSLAYHKAVRAYAAKTGMNLQEKHGLAMAEAGLKKAISEAMASSKLALRRVQAQFYKESEDAAKAQSPMQEGAAASAAHEDLAHTLNAVFGNDTSQKRT